MKIYESTPGGLYPQPGRKVTKFPSGRIRVDQTYVCTDEAVESARTTLTSGNIMPDGDSSPSIDGLYIFPTPDENRRGDGFTEFSVSAYGRVSTELSGIQITPVTVTYANSLKYKVYNIAGSITIPSGTALEYADLNLGSSLIDPFDFETVSGLALILDALIIDEGTKGEINDAGSMITRDFKLWQIRITNDGINPAYTYNVMIFPPSVSVKTYKNFGAFTEVDVETSIENSTTQITA